MKTPAMRLVGVFLSLSMVKIPWYDASLSTVDGEIWTNFAQRRSKKNKRLSGSGLFEFFPMSHCRLVSSLDI